MIEVVWAELRCEVVCLRVQNRMKTFMGIPDHPGTSDGLFNITQLYQGHLSEAVFPFDHSACLPQPAGFLGFYFLFSVFTGFHSHQGSKVSFAPKLTPMSWAWQAAGKSKSEQVQSDGKLVRPSTSGIWNIIK